jgi:hypothetical protein
MDYTEKYHKLRALFNPMVKEKEALDEGICYSSFDFFSTETTWDDSNQLHHKLPVIQPFLAPDKSIRENREFSYPVIYPESTTRFKEAILLLHGLNEKHWQKYLVWAWFLAKKTGKPVILFPIAFHMNRTPESWSNPRIMGQLLQNRNKTVGIIPASTFANLALSERLIENPLRFFKSGQQSAGDIVKLLSNINQGNHPLLEKGATVDVFAYSIGAFLAQILFLSNPNELLSESRLFMFCGGAFFDEMDGVSKLIMDQTAFNRLRRFYINDLDNELKHSPLLSDYLNTNPLGQAFSAMLTGSNLRSFRETKFRSMRNRIKSLALKNDHVIPANGILDVLDPYKVVNVMDFPYEYSHENPFPVNIPAARHLIDYSFDNVFNEAVTFFA